MIFILPPGAEPKWLKDWRCPHCGCGPSSFSYTSNAVERDGEIVREKVTEIECTQGHRRRIDGEYGPWPIDLVSDE